MQDILAEMGLVEMLESSSTRRQLYIDKWVTSISNYYGSRTEGRSLDSEFQVNAEAGFRQDEGGEEGKKRQSYVSMNITRPKAKTMFSRLVDMLFATNTANWDLMSSDEDDSTIKPEEREERDKKIQRMKDLMGSQLLECEYAKAAHRAIWQSVILCSGILKGPVGIDTSKEFWGKDEYGMWNKYWREDIRPRFECVDLINFFPDMDATSMEDCTHVFEMHLLSRKELQDLMGKEGFDTKAIRDILGKGSRGYALPGNDQRQTGKSSENNLIADIRRFRYVEGENVESDDFGFNRYILCEYHGPVQCGHLKQIAKKMKDKETLAELDTIMKAQNLDEGDDVIAIVWFMNDEVLRANIYPNPSGELIYSVFNIDGEEHGIFGDGIPAIMADAQEAMRQAWKILMSNAALSGLPILMLDQHAFPNGINKKEITSGNIIDFDSNRAGGDSPIIPVQVNGSTNEIMAIIERIKQGADDETNISPVSQGSSNVGGQGAGTAHGLSLIVNNANILFKNAVRAFDNSITIPCLRRLYEWNMTDGNVHDELKGSMKVVARGSSTLLVKDLRSDKLVMFLNMALQSPDFAMMMKVDSMARLICESMELDPDDVMKGIEEIREQERQMAEQQPPVDPNLELKMQIAQNEAQVKMEIEKMKLQTQLEIEKMKATMQNEQTKAQLAMKEEEIELKERLAAAEHGAKEKYGTGI